MPLPTPAKTWQFNVNIHSDVTGTDKGDMDSIFLKVKNALKTFALFPWVVVGSSNSLAFNMSGTDLLAVGADCVRDSAGNAHSWIVLKQPAINGNTSICIDLNHLTVSKLTLYFSAAAGFTGGSVTSRPTATDEVRLLDRAAWCGTWTGTAGFPFRAHVMQSTDGQCTRLITASDNVFRGMWLIDRPASPVAGWSSPAIATAVASNYGDIYGDNYTVGPFHYENWFGGTVRMAARGPLGDMPFKLTAESPCQYPAKWPYPVEPEIYIEPTAELGIAPIGLFHDVTVGQRGRHGHLFDLWVTSGLPAAGDTYPGDGSHRLIIVGNFALPWNGTNIVIG